MKRKYEKWTSNTLITQPLTKRQKISNVNDLHKYSQRDYRRYEFDGDIQYDMSCFKVFTGKYCKFGDLKIYTEMDIHTILSKLDIDIELLITNHNDYYKSCNVEPIKKTNLDSTLLISMIRQILCQKCKEQSTNIWCELCGIWSHSKCEPDVNEESVTFICKSCQ